MLVGKYKDRLVIEIPVDVAEANATTPDTQMVACASVYSIMNS